MSKLLNILDPEAASTPRCAHQLSKSGQALPNPVKRSRVWYLIEQIVGVGGLLTYFLAPRPFALAVVAAATAYCIGLGYVRRIWPLRERGTIDLEVAALVALLILSFGSVGWLLVSSAGRFHGAV